MKMLFVVDKYPYPKNADGVNIIVGNLLEKLYKGHQIEILITSNNVNDINQSDFKVHKVQIENKKLNISIVKKRFKRLFINPVILFKKSFKLHLNLDHYDVVVVFGFVNIQIFEYLQYKKNIKSIFYEIDSISLKYLRKSMNSILYKKIYYYLQYYLVKNIEKSVISFVDATIYVSDIDMKFMYLKTKNKNLHVLNNGIDVSTTRIKKFTNFSNTLNLCFSGNLDYGPNFEGVEYILNNLGPRIFNEIENAKFFIIGRNPSVKWFHNKFVKSGKIIITGYLEDIDKYLSDMDLYISPLFNGAGIKNKILQAMAIGLPIIATKPSIDGINELEVDKNVLICSKDTTSWIYAIKKYINSIEQLDGISSYNKDIVRKNYTWKKVSNKLIELINEVK